MISSLIHTMLNVAGMMPGVVGVVADVANGFLYMKEGDMAEAALSFLSATPALAGVAGKGAKGIFKSAKAAKYIDAGVNFVGNSSRMVLSMIGMDAAQDDINDNGENALNKGLKYMNAIVGIASLGKAANAGKNVLKFAAEDVGSLAKSSKLGKISSASLNEETFTRYLANGKQVTDVTNLPGSTGIELSRRLTNEEMRFLTQEYGVEFAQVYKYGDGINGGGGRYYLYSGVANRVTVPIGNDIMLINHTHPGGTAYPSSADKVLLGRYQQFGSPQRSSEIIPIGKANVRFNVEGVIGE